MLDIMTDLEVKAYMYLRKMYEPENISYRHQYVPTFITVGSEVKGYQPIQLQIIQKYRQEKCNCIRFYESLL